MPQLATQSGKVAPRPPVVVVLGHVDHGKTSILDKIRQTHVAEKEAGGITQHIGAYQIEQQNKLITFLDTPGHEAFSAIRARGAKVADIAILVVAAEEGVKPQTKEAIAIIKQAGIPFVVAINKIDKEGANPQKVRQELAEQAVMVEDYGGQVPVAEISARTGQGFDHLLELVLLLAELEELAAPTDTPASGLVIESHLDSRRGLIATLIVQTGQLHIGDWLAAGTAIGKAKSLEDFTGKPIKLAVAAQPCVLVGWESAPRVGQEWQVVPDKSTAEKLALEAARLGPAPLFVTETSGADAATAKKLVNLIVKADVQSSLEAIDNVLRTIQSEEVGYKIVGYGVGNISDTDIKSARATHAAIVGFHVDTDNSARQAAEREGIIIRTYQIIYELVENIRSLMSDLLEPEVKRTELGRLKVLALFKGGEGKSQIVGGKVTQGKAVRGALVDVMRHGILLLSGRLGQLQQAKTDVPEVAEGNECGIRFDASGKLLSPIAVGDVLEIYQEEKIKRQI